MAESTATQASEMLKPRTDLTSTVGKDVVVYFRRAEELAPLNLPLSDDGTLKCRLVGFDRQGAWLEPSSWLEEALERGGDVSHVMVGWENVLSVVRPHQTESFVSKKEYRGLRPSG